MPIRWMTVPWIRASCRIGQHDPRDGARFLAQGGDRTAKALLPAGPQARAEGVRLRDGLRAVRVRLREARVRLRDGLHEARVRRAASCKTPCSPGRTLHDAVPFVLRAVLPGPARRTGAARRGAGRFRLCGAADGRARLALVRARPENPYPAGAPAGDQRPGRRRAARAGPHGAGRCHRGGAGAEAVPSTPLPGPMLPMILAPGWLDTLSRAMPFRLPLPRGHGAGHARRPVRRRGDAAGALVAVGLVAPAVTVGTRVVRRAGA